MPLPPYESPESQGFQQKMHDICRYWENQLSYSVEVQNNRDIESLVESIAQTLGRGISLEDLDGALLAYSSNHGHADRVRVNFLLTKQVPSDVSEWQLSHGVAVAVRPVVIPANDRLGMLARVCVPLMVRGYRVGYLWVQQDEEDSSSAVLGRLPQIRDQVELLSGLLLESNALESEVRSRRERQFLAACRGDAAALAEMAGWPEVHNHGSWQLVCVLELAHRATGSVLAQDDPIAATLTHRTAALQATVGLDAVLFSSGTDTHALMLFQDEPGRAHHAAALVRYQRELGKRLGRPAERLIFGLSEGFAGLSALPAAYLEAQVAAQAGAVDPALGELVDCRATGLYQLLASAQPMSGRSVNYRMLVEQDRNRELLPVLELLYDSDGSVQEVADRLHLHRSSVYNRLARVRSLLGADPLRGHTRLELHAAFKAERWARRPRL